jgi:hypothetical protein
LEFPEVFSSTDPDSLGFDAIVGNPPFMGGQRITGSLGKSYRDFLVEYVAQGKRGSADICSYFFLRVGLLLRTGGMAGLLATNTIAQGDTSEVGLGQLLANDFSIPRAIPSRPWPGEANLEVAEVCLRKGPWEGAHILADHRVPGITALLEAPGRIEGKPFRLRSNSRKSFQGSIVLGMGFVIPPEKARELIANNPRNKDVLFPYLNGEDLNSRPDQSASRWVINFQDWPLDRSNAPTNYLGPVAADYPDCLSIVDDKVKPERQRLDNEGKFVIRKQRALRYWQYAERSTALYASISKMDRVIAVCLVTHHLPFAIVPTGQVFAHRLAVFPFHDYAVFAILQSNVHEPWARQYSSSLETRLNYSPSDCFETFPLPNVSRTLEQIGNEYYELRNRFLLERSIGLTEIYNRFHDPEEKDIHIEELRQIQVKMDELVIDSYGWRDLDLKHGFHTTKQGIRFTIGETSRRELLDRLLALNHQRHAEELETAPLVTVKKSKRKPNGVNLLD